MKSQRSGGVLCVANKNPLSTTDKLARAQYATMYTLSHLGVTGGKHLALMQGRQEFDPSGKFTSVFWVTQSSFKPATTSPPFLLRQ